MAYIKYHDAINAKDTYVCAIAISGIDIFHYSDVERDESFKNFATACAALDIDHKYIFTDITPDLTENKNFMNYKIHHSEGFIQYELQKRNNELSFLEQNHRDRLVYLLLYSDNEKKLIESADMFERYIDYVQTQMLNKEQLLLLLHKIATFDSEPNKNLLNKEYNTYIYPNKVHFKQNCYIVNDKTYVTSFVIYDYPAYIKDLLFASYVLQNSDVMITLDLKKRDREAVKREVERSLNELVSRAKIKQNVSDALDTETEYGKIQWLYDNIANGNEQVYNTTFRFVISGQSEEELSDKVKNLKKMLLDEGISGFVPLNNMHYEYFGMLLPNNKSKNPFPLYDTLSRQYPFYYQQHIDPTGMYFGRTETNGLVLLNTFTRNKKRPSFDLIATGVKGGGKSITLKTMLEDQLLLGNKVMVLDIEDEYSTMADVYNGQNIRMTKNSCINPLQIRKNIDADAENADSSIGMTVEEAAELNFLQEISRINTFFVQLNPDSDDDELRKLSELLQLAYIAKGIDKHTDLTVLSNADFPVFSDVLKVCNEQYDKADNAFDKELLAKLKPKLRQLSKGGSYEIFDNITNVDIDNSNLIVYNVKALSEMDEKIYNAQLFNILALMWAEICKNVAVNKGIINPYDRKNVIALIDEAHRFISEHNPKCVEFIEKLVRRSRKYFAGLWFATQSILDFLPNGYESAGRVADKIKVIFQLVQYKVILKQESSVLTTLKQAFPQFTNSELKSSTDFEPGEMLLALDSARMKIHCTRRATDLNLLYMGNSEDTQVIFNKIFRETYIDNNNPNGYTEYDFGKRLMTDNEFQDIFASEFCEVVYKTLELEINKSSVIDRIIFMSIKGLMQSLINKAEVNG